MYDSGVKPILNHKSLLFHLSDKMRWYVLSMEENICCNIGLSCVKNIFSRLIILQTNHEYNKLSYVQVRHICILIRILTNTINTYLVSITVKLNVIAVNESLALKIDGNLSGIQCECAIVAILAKFSLEMYNTNDTTQHFICDEIEHILTNQISQFGHACRNCEGLFATIIAIRVIFIMQDVILKVTDYYWIGGSVHDNLVSEENGDEFCEKYVFEGDTYFERFDDSDFITGIKFIIDNSNDGDTILGNVKQEYNLFITSLYLVIIVVLFYNACSLFTEFKFLSIDSAYEQYDSTLPPGLALILVGIWWLLFQLISFTICKKEFIKTQHKARQYSHMFHFLMLLFTISEGISTFAMIGALFGSNEYDISNFGLILLILKSEIVPVFGAVFVWAQKYLQTQ